MNRRPLTAAILTALVCAGLVGAAGLAAAEDTPTPSPAAKTIVFTVGTQQDLDSVNPFSMIAASAYEVSGLMYDTLTGYGLNFEPVPRLAEELPTVSSDGLTWTFKIRQGVTWNDGEPLTAKDVAYTFNRIMDGKYEKRNFGNYVRNLSTVEATDDFTVEMTTTKPSPIMNKLLVPILPEHIWKNISEDEVKTFTNEPDVEGGAVGSGPFNLTVAKNNQFYTLETNRDFYGKQPTIDQVTFRIFKNAEAMALALRNGEIDFADDVDASVFKALQGIDNITARNSQYYGFNYLTMNVGAQTTDNKPIGDGHPALQDPVVRKAIAMAVDKQTLVDRTLGGNGEPGTTVIPPLYTNFHLEPTDVTPFDIDAANQMLDDAGYTKGSDGIRVMPADSSDPGRRLEFRLYGRQESQSSQQTVKFVAEWLKEIGIATKVKTVSEDFLYEAAGQGTYDMYEWGWVVEPDPDYQVSTFTCGQRSFEDGGTIFAGLNDSFYCDKNYDALYEQQAVEIDEAKRADIVKQMQQLAYDANPYIVTFYYDYLQAYRNDRFTGFVAQPPPDGAILFQYGIYSYLNIKPVSATDNPSDSGGGVNVGVVAGAGALAAALIAGIWLVTRRRSGNEDVE